MKAPRQTGLSPWLFAVLCSIAMPKLWPKTSVLGADPRKRLLLQHKTLISQNLQLPFSPSTHLSSALKGSIFWLFPTLSMTQKETKIPGTQGTRVENCQWLFQTCDLTEIFTSTGDFSQQEATSLSGNILGQVPLVLARRVWPEGLPWQCFLTAFLTKTTHEWVFSETKC